ncbi:MAG: DUF6502 family protein [Betaproteobacteria bacterium]
MQPPPRLPLDAPETGGQGLSAGAGAAEETLAALASLMAPLAQLAVRHGVSHRMLDERLRQAMVDAAAALMPDVPAHRGVSRISAATGLNRREVTRLSRGAQPRSVGTRSRAGEVFARWMSDPAYQDPAGTPLALPRLGPAPSFEVLAASVTTDVHARSLMDELLRLGLASYDQAADSVHLKRDGFVPTRDRHRLLGLLADNVGDHLQAAVDNVSGDGRRHFEQAVFADGLSGTSVQAFRAVVSPLWRSTLASLVPVLQRMVEEDGRLPADQATHRVRLGLYAFDDFQAPPKVEHSQGDGPAVPQGAMAAAPTAGDVAPRLARRLAAPPGRRNS